MFNGVFGDTLEQTIQKGIDALVKGGELAKKSGASFTNRVVKLTGKLVITWYGIPFFTDWEDIQNYKPLIQKSLAKYYNVSDLVLYQKGNDAGFDLSVNTSDNLNTIRQNVVTAFVEADSSLTEVLVWLVSDGSKQIAPNQTRKIIADASVTTGKVVKGAIDKTVKDLDEKGITGLALKGLDKALFGEEIDIFGMKIPKLLVYGVIGFAIYKQVSK